MIERESERRHAAHGQADEVKAFEFQGIGERDDVSDQLRKAVGASRYLAQAVAALVVAHDPVALAQELGLRLPHREVGAERVGEDDGRRVGRSVDDMVQLDGPGRDQRHVHSPSSRLTAGMTVVAINSIERRASAGSAQSWPA